MNFPPWSAYILTAFSLAFGFVLHRAALLRAYRITGIRLLDAFVLAWLLGLLAGYTPVFLYLAFGFHEFTNTPDGTRLLNYLHWIGRAEAIFFVAYAIFITSTVSQKSGPSITSQEIGQTIIANVIFAVIAILFTAIAALFRRQK